MRSTAACRPPRSTAPSGTTRALPVAKFTSALATPGWRPSTRWTRTAHEPQVMPCTSKFNRPVSAGAAGARVVSVMPVASRLPDWPLPAGDLVPLLLDRLDQVAAVDRGVVVGHRHRPCWDVDGGALDATDGGQGPLDRHLAVVTVDLRNGDGLSHHHTASFPERSRSGLPCPRRSPSVRSQEQIVRSQRLTLYPPGVSCRGWTTEAARTLRRNKLRVGKHPSATDPTGKPPATDHTAAAVRSHD